MNISSAKFVTSVVNRKDILETGFPEFAFVGRSNVGKSSMINNLVGIKNLAKTSAMPGLTKMINYFLVNEKFLFVDLPGYGFAKTSKVQKEDWTSLIGDYLLTSNDLRVVFVLLDIRHLPNELDKIMINFLIENNMPFAIVATKADKLSTMAQKKAVEDIAKHLSIRQEMIFVHSSSKSIGKETLLEFIDGVINS